MRIDLHFTRVFSTKRAIYLTFLDDRNEKKITP